MCRDNDDFLDWRLCSCEEPRHQRSALPDVEAAAGAWTTPTLKLDVRVHLHLPERYSDEDIVFDKSPK
ncbi:hypothetical protein M9H77_11370 [Catharanthus roseus]|uniref:Uncharacterized protein n=1 Tax=Catharanthus roseus TaxID=4058 RepID=A0ACC0BEE3_CATRO|nr:hypothetical protein M9H77_11370 [Catharanthus roseus]